MGQPEQSEGSSLKQMLQNTVKNLDKPDGGKEAKGSDAKGLYAELVNACNQIQIPKVPEETTECPKPEVKGLYAELVNAWHNSDISKETVNEAPSEAGSNGSTAVESS